VSTGQKVTLISDAYQTALFTGEITVINPKVDTNTRNVQIRATLKNPNHKLLPGMYVTVNIATGNVQRFITLPRTAIIYNTFGASVYRVDSNSQDKTSKSKLIAKQQLVTTGDTRGDQIAILSGIKEGETIVTTGQIKLRNGSPVTIDNSVSPSNDANPELKDQ
jgi:membrane fusion protein (multidrug efflux system)